MAHVPPPLLREDRLTLEQLGRMAREYDQISRGEHWPATDFVRWLADEWASAKHPDHERISRVNPSTSTAWP